MTDFCRRRGKTVAGSQFAIRNSQFRSGIALVITLIMLSVTLIMAVAFLAGARRERNAVSTTTDTAIARLATESALAAAEAQIAANLLATNNYFYNLTLLVSTNIIVDPTVPYDPTSAVWATNVQPRAPVFVPLTNGGYDFRFYLDLNRNGKDDANGLVADVNGTGAALGTTNLQVGDPEWIGVLERPDANPANNNKFISRYAFLAQPVANGLDLNYIHNQAQSGPLNPTLPLSKDSYLRNQGVGSWELNLASFLADLNTNQWAGGNYAYNEASGGAFNGGNAFSDALALLSYRYNYNYNTLATANACLANTANYPTNIDAYSVGPLQTSVDYNAGATLSLLANPWAGANNTNHFFALPSELFDTTKVGPNFPVDLAAAGSGRSTYDRYTFYRLLSQLGTDSTADDGRMNLNYDNLDASGAVIPGAETNLIAWTAETNGALRFFTNAANRLLTNATTTWRAANGGSYLATYGTGGAFGLTNIPVYVNGKFVYTSAVNRLLQLAANMYDAENSSPYPSVFRPQFWVTTQNNSTNVYINGYTYVASVIGTNDPVLLQPADVADVAAKNSGTVNTNVNVYGVPWIIGAKKGLPNFNQFNMLNLVKVTRKLQVTRPPPTATDPTPQLNEYQTNQMYIFDITNQIGCSLWNSYVSTYPRPVTIVANDMVTMLLTNDDPLFNPYSFTNGLNGSLTNGLISVPITTTWLGTTWTGGSSTNANPTASLDAQNNHSFIVPLNLTNSLEAIYRFAGYYGAANAYLDPGMIGCQTYDNTANPTSGLGLTPPLPHFGLVATNRLQIYILDGTHVIDYVHFAGPDSYLDISGQLGDPKGTLSAGQLFLWNTNPVSGGTTPQGVVDQITYSELGPTNPLPINYTLKSWDFVDTTPPALPQIVQGLTPASMPFAEAAFFTAFFNVVPSQYNFGQVTITTGGSPGGSGGNGTTGGNRSGGGTLGSSPLGPGGGSTGSSPGGSTGSSVTTNAVFFNTETNVQAPYTPSRLIFTNISWQANDPLVHYLASDLNYNFSYNSLSPSDNPDGDVGTLFTHFPNMTNLTSRYSPWGQPYPSSQAVDATWSSLMKDPLVYRSDYWDFPTNKYPTAGWLGRVHRGTPWQTVYLKASDIEAANNGPNSWSQWTGDGNTFDAANSAPLADETLFDLFGAAPDGNATQGTLSVNQPGLAAWSAVFGGVVALTNATATVPGSGYFAPVVTNLVISPAGADLTNSAVATLVNGLNALRSGFVNADGLAGAFEHVGSILRSPTLTEQSPLLNWSDTAQQKYGISDELYEWLPQQTIGLLRVATVPRYVIYCYGQTLRPAANGINAATGLVTNYQIVAESAVRAVVHMNKSVSGGVTNYTAVIESYSPLPPN